MLQEMEAKSQEPALHRLFLAISFMLALSNLSLRLISIIHYLSILCKMSSDKRFKMV